MGKSNKSKSNHKKSNKPITNNYFNVNNSINDARKTMRNIHVKKG